MDIDLHRKNNIDPPRVYWWGESTNALVPLLVPCNRASKERVYVRVGSSTPAFTYLLFAQLASFVQLVLTCTYKGLKNVGFFGGRGGGFTDFHPPLHDFGCWIG